VCVGGKDHITQQVPGVSPFSGHTLNGPKNSNKVLPPKSFISTKWRQELLGIPYRNSTTNPATSVCKPLGLQIIHSQSSLQMTISWKTQCSWISS
jgi:hypothetical protein